MLYRNNDLIRARLLRSPRVQPFSGLDINYTLELPACGFFLRIARTKNYSLHTGIFFSFPSFFFLSFFLLIHNNRNVKIADVLAKGLPRSRTIRCSSIADECRQQRAHPVKVPIDHFDHPELAAPHPLWSPQGNSYWWFRDRKIGRYVELEEKTGRDVIFSMVNFVKKS